MTFKSVMPGQCMLLVLLMKIIMVFGRLSGYELAGNETFLQHGSSEDWGGCI